jgi:molybdenum transport protein
MTILSDAALDALLAEDAPFGDLTTEALGIGERPARITFAARTAMVLACVEEAERLLQRAGAATRRGYASGALIPPATVFLAAEGPAAAVHRAWKTAQTLVESASGIAGAVRRIVEAAQAAAPDVAVECTRKTLPGSRGIARRAVAAGGGQMHRLGLSETLLVFPEHLGLLDGGAAAAVAALKQRVPGKMLTVEVGTRADALAMAQAGADILQLERLSPAEAAEVAAATRDRTPPPLIAAAGGVNEGNAAAYAAAGCRILVTSAPYWARPADVKVTIAPAPAGDALTAGR